MRVLIWVMALCYVVEFMVLGVKIILCSPFAFVCLWLSKIMITLPFTCYSFPSRTLIMPYIVCEVLLWIIKLKYTLYIGVNDCAEVHFREQVKDVPVCDSKDSNLQIIWFMSLFLMNYYLSAKQNKYVTKKTRDCKILDKISCYSAKTKENVKHPFFLM